MLGCTSYLPPASHCLSFLWMQHDLITSDMVELEKREGGETVEEECFWSYVLWLMRNLKATLSTPLSLLVTPPFLIHTHVPDSIYVTLCSTLSLFL